MEVPYWWDFSKESLAVAIGNVRPDIALKHFANVSDIPRDSPDSRGNSLELSCDWNRRLGSSSPESWEELGRAERSYGMVILNVMALLQ